MATCHYAEHCFDGHFLSGYSKLSTFALAVDFGPHSKSWKCWIENGVKHVQFPVRNGVDAYHSKLSKIYSGPYACYYCWQH